MKNLFKTNSAKLSKMLAAKVGITKQKAYIYTRELIKLLADEIIAGKDVNITPLGSFSIRNWKATTKRNPRTKKSVSVPAKKNVKFKASIPLKRAIQD